MSPAKSRSPVYIVRPGSDDNVYDAEVYEPAGHDDNDEQLFASLLQQIMHMWRDNRTPGTSSAPPGPIPASPRKKGLGSGEEDAPATGKQSPSAQRSRLPYFFAVAQTVSGSWMMSCHVPRKVVLAFFVVMFLVVIGISQVPALGDLLFSLI
ncbi:MAG: hypothetical protein JW910_05330 [Anaerolineae bacterium]|nr:hypothetical protein [Anaerolineae bacterium]